MIDRKYNACLLRPEDIPPSRDDLEVIGTFNPGAVRCGDEIVLLVRVAERPKERREGFVSMPRFDVQEGITVDWIPRDQVEQVEPRVFKRKRDGLVRLTFISYLAVVRSSDGRTIDSVDRAGFMPASLYEEFGVEDPRITPLDGKYYITYVGASRHGVSTCLASTEDFCTFERHGIIFYPENKDVMLFPERIGGDYYALHRPNAATPFTLPEMWIASSPDLCHWGGYKHLHAASTQYETGKIGGGTPPIRVGEHWLEIYHGNIKPKAEGDIGMYTAGLLLLDGERPNKVLRRSVDPIMLPETDYEREGFVPNVVFPTGIVPLDDTVLCYYGGADTVVGVVEWALDDLTAQLTDVIS